MVKLLTAEEFYDEYEEWLYCYYMESGCYYDMEREDFDELHYEEYVKRWEREAEERQVIEALGKSDTL